MRAMPAPRLVRSLGAALLVILVAALLPGAAAAILPHPPATGAPSAAGTQAGSAAPRSVAWTSLGDQPPAADGTGYTVSGLQADGYTSRLGERFVAQASGRVGSARLAVHQFGAGGDGTFTIRLFADDDAAPGQPGQPGQPGTVLASAIGEAPRSEDPATQPTLVALPDGASLVAGRVYWLVIEPSPLTRLAWTVNQAGSTGSHLAADPWQVRITSQPQAAFEIVVRP